MLRSLSSRAGLAAIAVALTLGQGAIAAPADDATVVAKVNGEDVTLGQLRVLREGVGERADGLAPEALWDMLLDQATRQAAVAQAAEGNLTPRDEAALTLQRRAYLASLSLVAVAEVPPTEEELRAAYDKTYGGAAPVTEYDASHILVETEEAAKAVEADLAAGKPFGEVAEARSTGTSGPNQGDLGWFTLDMMVPPFADAVAKLQPGAVSPPVQTQFGWHVIRLNNTRTRAVPAIDEVRDSLTQQLNRERVDAAVAKMLGEAKVERTPGLTPDLLNAAD